MQAVIFEATLNDLSLTCACEQELQKIQADSKAERDALSQKVRSSQLSRHAAAPIISIFPEESGHPVLGCR